jgi:hypothetical protein
VLDLGLDVLDERLLTCGFLQWHMLFLLLEFAE